MPKSLFGLLKEGSSTKVFEVRDDGFFVNGTLLFSDIMFHQEVIDPPSISTNANINIEVTIPGISVGDFILSASGTDIEDLVVAVHVVGTDTATLNLSNGTAGAVDLPSSTWNFIVFKR